MTLKNEHFSLHTLIASVASELIKKYTDKELSVQYAWWMLEAIMQTNKTQLLTNTTITLTPQQKKLLFEWIQKQVKDNIPLQYLIGSVPFGTCTIEVQPPILIPRPETEEWCLALITALKKVSYTSFSLLDLCTGSGCIAIAIAKAFPQATIYAVDISAEALALAQKNAYRNNVFNITFIQSDLFNNVPPSLSFHVIVANPPYISHEEWQELDPAVRTWEDPQALIAPEDGLALIKRIIAAAPAHLQPHSPLIAAHIPQLVLEIGNTHGNAVTAFFHNAGFSHCVIQQDLFQNDRVAIGYLPYEIQSRV